ncbi:unnamed protein product [Eruca vesicaria subsp. sativa]|uniref:Uncharacterized protein n=1 Tax=Eruca vesicaria subsp. sativa TaxID=29727 RepID=A0ABC8LL95_ERUVS|nr:unnamed protein product [Eruca vesicaria subsp. sativa]
MEDYVEKEHAKGRRRQPAASIMFLWGILIFAQFSVSSSALSPDQYYHQPYTSPRKVGPFYKTASFHPPRASMSFTSQHREAENRDDVFKEDKRFVHTGPNPLHN